MERSAGLSRLTMTKERRRHYGLTGSARALGIVAVLSLLGNSTNGIFRRDREGRIF